jgi:CheY-like chemotaxis protein
MLAGPGGDLFRFGLLMLPAGAFVWRSRSWARPRIGTIAAVASALGIGIIGLERMDEAADGSEGVHLGVFGLAALQPHQAGLQLQAEIAHDSRVPDVPEQQYADHAEQILVQIGAVEALAATRGFEALRVACVDARLSVIAHRQQTRELFAQLSLGRAAWGNEDAVRDAESSATAAHLATRERHARLVLALTGVASRLAEQGRSAADSVATLGSSMLGLWWALGLLGVALLLERFRSAREVVHDLQPLEGTGLGNARILVVDDALPDPMQIHAFLAEHGIDAAFAEDEAEALRMLDENRFDLILTDPGFHDLAAAEASESADAPLAT